ncbi:hypothetical protein [Deinococcus budaensis]|uniref:Icc-related predicted phosphoesterase n=1 Tax=Deinococcus budaensis TaxID=1665626 RepID=A0A7W8GH76_9DEIO|nr:hypothetical protein [Deinococcus budaensis]MBB5235575.1 Icc-related predicted phosphoesterase [Deinococcus budaensis]
MHVFGHIHEGHGRVQQERTLFINAALCDVSYQANRLPQVTELGAR